MSRRNLGVLRTPSGTDLRSELDTDVVPITHTVFYRREGDSLIPIPLQLEAEDYESDDELLGMIDQIEEEFEDAKNKLNKILCKADDNTHPCLDGDSVLSDKVNTSIKAVPAHSIVSPTSIVSFDANATNMEDINNNDDKDDDISAFTDELTFKRKNESKETPNSKRLKTLRFSTPPRVCSSNNTNPLSSSDIRNIISPESQTTRSFEYLSLVQYPTNSNALNRELHYECMDDESSSQLSTMSPHTTPTSTERSLSLEVKANNLPQTAKKKVLRNYLRKRKPSVYFELYSCTCDTASLDQQEKNELSSEWNLMYRSCTILKDSNPCWEVSDIKLNWPFHLSKDINVKISLFELNKKGTNHLIGSSVTTIGYIIAGFTVSQVFLSKKGKSGGSISVKAGVQ